MKIFVAGLSNKTAPVEVRERVAVPAAQLGVRGGGLKQSGNLSEIVLVSTCNRVEIYGVSTGRTVNIHRLFEELFAGREPLDLSTHLYVKEGAEAVEHLFAVTDGLDSLVLGETEITGQIKQAYQTAQEANLTGRVLNRVFQKALQTAKAIRTKTGVGRGAVSVGSVAVELAQKIFGGNLARQSVMIIGAGKMGEACLRHLSKKGAGSVLVSNRSFDRAESLALEFGGRAIRFEDRLKAMAEADIVVSSTGSSHTLLNRQDMAQVMRSRRNRPLVLIDIAVPRDVAAEVGQVDNVYLYDVDDLEGIVLENVRRRGQELAQCAKIVAVHAKEMLARINGAPAGTGRSADCMPLGVGLLQPAT